jgi:outer membrane protein TolC
MKNPIRFIRCFLLIAVALCPATGFTQTTELGLQQALRLAEAASPDLKAAMAREQEAMETSTIAESGFYPTLDLAAVDSGGFPGSSSGTDGFAGLITSPYRSGPAAGAFSKWDLVDISLWHDVSAAHYAYDASREAVRFQRAVVDQQALGVYLAGTRYRGEAEAWQKLVTNLLNIQNTVNRFVRNGQYSEVAKILLDDQLKNADLEVHAFTDKYQTELIRLGLLIGMDPQKIACPLPVGLSEDELGGLVNQGASPLILRADYEKKAASEAVGKYSAENLPKLELAASAGYLSDTRLVDEQDYSVFVGVTVPIFEGFRIDAEEKRARAEEEAKTDELTSAKLTLADLNAQYDQQIETAREDLQTLIPEQDSAKRGVDIAKQRYLAFLSPLADLQQALRDMVNVDTQIAEVKTNLLLALGSKAFLDGQSLSVVTPAGGRP